MNELPLDRPPRRSYNYYDGGDEDPRGGAIRKIMSPDDDDDDDGALGNNNEVRNSSNGGGGSKYYYTGRYPSSGGGAQHPWRVDVMRQRHESAPRLFRRLGRRQQGAGASNKKKTKNKKNGAGNDRTDDAGNDNVLLLDVIDEETAAAAAAGEEEEEGPSAPPPAPAASATFGAEGDDRRCCGRQSPVEDDDDETKKVGDDDNETNDNYSETDDDVPASTPTRKPFATTTTSRSSSNSSPSPSSSLPAPPHQPTTTTTTGRSNETTTFDSLQLRDELNERLRSVYTGHHRVVEATGTRSTDLDLDGDGSSSAEAALSRFLKSRKLAKMASSSSSAAERYDGSGSDRRPTTKASMNAVLTELIDYSVRRGSYKSSNGPSSYFPPSSTAGRRAAAAAREEEEKVVDAVVAVEPEESTEEEERDVPTAQQQQRRQPQPPSRERRNNNNNNNPTKRIGRDSIAAFEAMLAAAGVVVVRGRTAATATTTTTAEEIIITEEDEETVAAEVLAEEEEDDDGKSWEEYTVDDCESRAGRGPERDDDDEWTECTILDDASVALRSRLRSFEQPPQQQQQQQPVAALLDDDEWSEYTVEDDDGVVAAAARYHATNPGPLTARLVAGCRAAAVVPLTGEGRRRSSSSSDAPLPEILDTSLTSRGDDEGRYRECEGGGTAVVVAISSSRCEDPVNGAPEKTSPEPLVVTATTTTTNAPLDDDEWTEYTVEESAALDFAAATGPLMARMAAQNAGSTWRQQTGISEAFKSEYERGHDISAERDEDVSVLTFLRPADSDIYTYATIANTEQRRDDGSHKDQVSVHSSVGASSSELVTSSAVPPATPHSAPTGPPKSFTFELQKADTSHTGNTRETASDDGYDDDDDDDSMYTAEEGTVSSEPASMSKRTPDRITEVLRHDIWSRDPTVVASALHALADEASRGAQSRKDIVQFGGLLAIIRAMEVNLVYDNVQIAACTALRDLSIADDRDAGYADETINHNNSNQRAIVHVGGIQAIVAAMNGHPDTPEVQDAACTALARLTDNCVGTDALNHVQLEGVVEVIVNCMDIYADRNSIQENCFRTLANLCLDNEKRLRELAEARGLEVMTMALQTPWKNHSNKHEAISTLSVLLRCLAEIDRS